MNYSGITIGLCSLIGDTFMSFVVTKIQRKKWTIIFQYVVLLCVAILYFLSKTSDTNLSHYAQGFVSAGVMTFCNSGQYAIFYIQLSEIFDPEIRGLVAAITLTVAKLVGSCAPILSKFSENFGLHVMIGCSCFLLPSLVMSYFQKETMIREDVQRKNLEDLNNSSTNESKLGLAKTSESLKETLIG